MITASLPARNGRSRAFLILPRIQGKGMQRGRPRMPALAAAVVLLLAAAVFTPVAAMSLPANASSTSGQIQSLIQAAVSSRGYAATAIGAASVHGLDVTAAQAQLAAGDVQLAQANSDLSSGFNVAAGILAAQTAMSDYTSAAASASIALKNAGLTAYVDLSATESAVAEVNATVSVIASVQAKACASGSATVANASALAQACAQVSAEVKNATVDMRRAASITAQLSAGAATNVNLSDAAILVAQARAELNSASAGLRTVASFGYAARARAFLANVLLVVSAKANATIALQQSALSNYIGVGAALAGDVSTQASAIGNVTAAAGLLSSSVSAANGYLARVAANGTAVQEALLTSSSDLSNLTGTLALLIPVSSLTQIDADVSSTQTAVLAYNGSVSTLMGDTRAFGSTALSTTSTFAAAFHTDTQTAGTDGSVVLNDYAKVKADLSLLITAFPLLKAELGPLNATLYSDASAISSSRTALAGSAGSAQTQLNTTAALYGSFSTAVSSSKPGILALNDTVAPLASLVAEESLYLNSSSTASLRGSLLSLQAAAGSSLNFTDYAEAMLGATAGGFAASGAALASKGASLESQSSAAAQEVSHGSAYISADAEARAALVSTANAEFAHALALFASLQTAAGTSDVAHAEVSLYAAAGIAVPG